MVRAGMATGSKSPGSIAIAARAPTAPLPPPLPPPPLLRRRPPPLSPLLVDAATRRINARTRPGSAARAARVAASRIKRNRSAKNTPNARMVNQSTGNIVSIHVCSACILVLSTSGMNERLWR